MRIVMLSASEKAVLGNLNYTCRKVLQAYRIRMSLFQKRYILLSEIDREYGRIANKESLFIQLRNILDREKRVLSIIEKSQPEVGNNLGYALRQLEEARRISGAYLKNIPLPHNKALPVKEAEEFLLQMINGLRQMTVDIEGVKARMAAEEQFLTEKSENKSVLFMQYLKAWEAEVRANESMMAHINGILNANRSLVVDKMRVDWMSLMGVLSAGVAGIIAIRAVSTGSETAAMAAKIVMASGAVWIIASFLYNLSSLSKEVFLETRREEQLLKDLESKMARGK
ncbi:MAG: hypothetical protein V1702_01095 [Candidatus Woesearchaeota archaeon]